MGAMGVEGHGGWVERGKGGASGAGGRACCSPLSHLIGSRGIGPGGRVEQAERERAGIHWGPLKSFDWV